MRILRKVHDEIMRTIGSRRPEEGGMLLTSDGGMTITKFIFDDKGSRTGGTYSPNVEFLNEHIKKQNNKGFYFVGIVHSHPTGFTTLSMGRHGGCGHTASDEEAILKLFAGMKGTKKLYFPVVQSSVGGKFSMRMFYGERLFDGRIHIGEEVLEIVEDEFVRQQRQAIQGVIPTSKYNLRTAILVDAGSAASTAEQLARSGVNKFVLIDGRKYTAQDVSNGACGWRDIGTYVADSVARRIYAINPTAEIKVIRQFIDKDVDHKVFEQWLEGATKYYSLICLCGGDTETVALTKKLAEKAKISLLLSYKPSGYPSLIEIDYHDYYYADKKLTYEFKALYTGLSEVQQMNSALAEKALRFFAESTAKKKRLALACSAEKEAASKYEPLYTKDEISKKTVVIVGCGGSRSYAENLARGGVRRFVLVDGDTYSLSNLQTQMAYADEIGQSKVEVMASKIRLINPEAEVITIPRMLDEKVSDDEFAEWVGGVLTESPNDVLIAGCTDNFTAQARCSRLALKYGCPYLQAGIYPGGRVLEIVFFHPAINTVCPRCSLKKRYEANLNAEKKPAPAVSNGTSVFFTEELNAKKGFISLALLLWQTDADRRYSQFLDDNMWATPKRKRKVDRNFVYYTMDSHMEESTGIKAWAMFDSWGRRLKSLYQLGVCLFVKKRPKKGCPDCGGKGKLLISKKGKITDTREGLYPKEV